MNVYLIGFRGTGKTTVGRRLSERLNWPAIDADELLEQRAGTTIKEIFASQGEAAFRDLESLVIEELAACDRTVISLGGGAVLREQNRRAIQGRGQVIWLQAAAPTIFGRLSDDQATADRRPDLTDLGGYAEIVELLQRRSPIYRDCADVVVDTEGMSPDQVAAQIVSLLGDWLAG